VFYEPSLATLGQKNSAPTSRSTRQQTNPPPVQRQRSARALPSKAANDLPWCAEVHLTHRSTHGVTPLELGVCLSRHWRGQQLTGTSLCITSALPNLHPRRPTAVASEPAREFAMSGRYFASRARARTGIVAFTHVITITQSQATPGRSLDNTTNTHYGPLIWANLVVDMSPVRE